MEIGDSFDLPYTLPDFPFELRSIRDYQHLINNTFVILNNHVERIEKLLDDEGLIQGVEEDLRSARGKIIVISKNNLSTFDKLLKEVRNDKQGLADLNGFWSLIVPELKDVQEACEKVEKHRRNRGRLSIPLSSSLQKQVSKSLIPQLQWTSTASPTSNTSASQISRSQTLKEFLAARRHQRAKASNYDSSFNDFGYKLRN